MLNLGWSLNSPVTSKVGAIMGIDNVMEALFIFFIWFSWACANEVKSRLHKTMIKQNFFLIMTPFLVLWARFLQVLYAHPKVLTLLINLIDVRLRERYELNFLREKWDIEIIFFVLIPEN